MGLCFNSSKAMPFLSEDEIKHAKKEAFEAFDILYSKSGKGNDFLGWLDYPVEYPKDEMERIKKAANKIKEKSKVLVVIGIGGSYLGAAAVIDALSPYFKRDDHEVIFAGNSLSSTYLSQLVEYLQNKEFSINVISKSGTTTEPAVAYRCLLNLLKEKHENDYKDFLYYTTDSKTGCLHDMGVKEGIELFSVPTDMGGRYSVFSAVGMLPIACAGFDIDMIIEGAKDAYNNLKVKSDDNEAIKYALYRTALYKKGYTTEILESYELKLSSVSEWWKQLNGESMGKENKGIFPSSMIFTRDLHSLGQYVQEGERNLFETLLDVTYPEVDYMIPMNEDNLDGLNYLKDKSVNDVNRAAMIGTVNAHNDGGVPVLIISLESLCEYSLGYLLYFFMVSCAISCYMIGINPFDQPGVEAYKKNMFKLLKKPGYDK